MLTNNNNEKIAKILGNFDFVKTQALMKKLDWTWVTESSDFEQKIPTVSEMVDMAHMLLVRAVNGNGSCSSGGFEATFNMGVFTLKFITEESSNEDDFVIPLYNKPIKY